jgi:hypothetical protein
MENPEFAVWGERVWLEARGVEESACTLVDVAGNAVHGSGDKIAGARGLVLLAAVDQHMDVELGVHRRDRIAHAPSRRQAAPRAAGGTGKYNATSHA